jgi:hypothetical protein
MHGMERQLTDMKRSTEERIAQGEEVFQQTQEAWQEAIARASEAEKRAREFEETISRLQEQQQVDQIHQQLWPNGDTLMKAPATQAVGNSSHDTSMEELASKRKDNKHSGDDDDDTDMEEVKSIIYNPICIQAHLF